MPAANGASGPTTVRSILDSTANFASPPISLALTRTRSATCAMPAFPGAQSSSDGLVAFLRNAQASACSLPPEPTIRILISLSDRAHRPDGQPQRLQSAKQTLPSRSLKKFIRNLDTGL